jgi:hypothetical protein
MTRELIETLRDAPLGKRGHRTPCPAAGCGAAAVGGAHARSAAAAEGLHSMTWRPCACVLPPLQEAEKAIGTSAVKALEVRGVSRSGFWTLALGRDSTFSPFSIPHSMLRLGPHPLPCRASRSWVGPPASSLADDPTRMALHDLCRTATPQPSASPRPRPPSPSDSLVSSPTPPSGRPSLGPSNLWDSAGHHPCAAREARRLHNEWP